MWLISWHQFGTLCGDDILVFGDWWFRGHLKDGGRRDGGEEGGGWECCGVENETDAAARFIAKCHIQRHTCHVVPFNPCFIPRSTKSSLTAYTRPAQPSPPQSCRSEVIFRGHLPIFLSTLAMHRSDDSDIELEAQSIFAGSASHSKVIAHAYHHCIGD